MSKINERQKIENSIIKLKFKKLILDTKDYNKKLFLKTLQLAILDSIANKNRFIKYSIDDDYDLCMFVKNNLVMFANYKIQVRYNEYKHFTGFTLEWGEKPISSFDSWW